jgi:hypothetical protein
VCFTSFAHILQDEPDKVKSESMLRRDLRVCFTVCLRTTYQLYILWRFLGGGLRDEQLWILDLMIGFIGRFSYNYN